MSRTGDALRKASSTVSAALDEALVKASAEGQPQVVVDAINDMLEEEQAGNGATAAVKGAIAIADEADNAALNPPQS